MVLQPAIPTLEALNTKNETRVDNVFCSETLTGKITRCYVDPKLRPPLTDHYAIITEIDLLLETAPQRPKRNWRKTEWDVFLADFINAMDKLAEPTEITTIEEFDTRLKNAGRNHMGNNRQARTVNQDPGDLWSSRKALPAC
ncbi:hypothetical protein BDP27DRAFT_1234654 [Rhodocollybia butyracea]|uniref:Uncharacterized protein n=1 Tax=Rhodocollybia butyracea TaxID=206335 RepID=A0A9P5PE61_9AGAR|nr:hypothetical protein BDP27DRAFT_1234654 [Rhodocollybia butyracea]